MTGREYGNGEKRVGRRPSRRRHVEELTAATLTRSAPVFRTVFADADAADLLSSRLIALLDTGAVIGATAEITVEVGRRYPATAVGVFLSDEAYDGLHTVGLEQLDRWLLDHVLRVGGGVLTHDQIARGNAGGGLHLLMLCFKAADPCATDADRLVIVREMMAHLFPEFVGYNLISLTGRIVHLDQILSGLQAGCRLLRPAALPEGSSLDEMLSVPVLLTAHRDWVGFASWMSAAFGWREPRFAFSRSEQQTLRLALRGYRDAEIAEACVVSGSTVKKRWDSILARASAVDADLFDGAEASGTPGRRGAEKRTVLLDYLAAHREEIRPYRAP